MAEPIISFKKLNITFGENVVINNIDLDIRQGETLAVLGPSGSGKSTVLRAMIGLLQPTAGEIFVQGEQVSYLDEDDTVEQNVKAAKNGNNVITTIDITLQSIVEKYIQQFNEEHAGEEGSRDSGRRILCLLYAGMFR